MLHPYVGQECIPAGHRSQVRLERARAKVNGTHLDLHEFIEVEHWLVHVLAAGPGLEALVEDGCARMECAALRCIVFGIIILTTPFVSTASHSCVDASIRAGPKRLETEQGGRGERPTFGMRGRRARRAVQKRQSRSNLPEIVHAPHARDSRARAVAERATSTGSCLTHSLFSDHSRRPVNLHTNGHVCRLAFSTVFAADP